MFYFQLWKARANGYELLSKQARDITDENSPEWNKYLHLMKKIVIDSNVAAQEKGLDAVLSILNNAGAAGK